MQALRPVDVCSRQSSVRNTDDTKMVLARGLGYSVRERTSNFANFKSAGKAADLRNLENYM